MSYLAETKGKSDIHKAKELKCKNVHSFEKFIYHKNFMHDMNLFKLTVCAYVHKEWNGRMVTMISE